VALYAAGQLIRPLHGISKDHGTDAYSLVTAGESCLILALFYLTMDVWKFRAWGAWLLPVGINPLLAYILPDIFSSAVDLTHTWELFWRWNTGWPGVGNAAVITLILFAVAAGLTRLRVVMKL
jgi:predicted acyltransferase